MYDNRTKKKVNRMNYLHTAIVTLAVALMMIGVASADPIAATYDGSGSCEMSYEISWSGSGTGEITIDTYTPQGFDTVFVNWENSMASGIQTVNTDQHYTGIHRDVSLTDGYARTHTQSISGDFITRTYSTDFRQDTAFTRDHVYVFDWS